MRDDLPVGSIPVTVVVAARDEAANIDACLGSVAWAAERIVVENGSVDDTAAIAQAAGAIVMDHPFVTIGGQRNAAIAAARHEWILVVDADERASPELAADVRQVVTLDGVSGGAVHAAYRVPRRNFFLGREVRHGGWEKDRPVRLFRRTLRYDDSRVHEHVHVTGVVGKLRGTLVHAPYRSLSAYFEKFVRYSAWWAEQNFARGRRARAWDVLVKPPARFFSMYVVRGGWRDGGHGMVLAALAAGSVMAKYARLWELSHTRRST